MTAINADLKLVVPLRVDDEGEPALYAYHTPISLEVYEANFRLLGDAKTAIMGDNARHAFMARADAPLYLREAGRALALARGVDGDGGASALLSDLKRLTLVLVPGAQGWDMLPVDTAIQRNAIDVDDWADAEADIVFFTVWAAGSGRKGRAAQMAFAARLINGQTTSLQPMEWTASLPTLTQGGGTASKAASSVPS
ncbi:MAG: hypothetical protein KGL35_14725 [Bradyrhizobium sp.]|nr:hypothetical protein [Bradyrhizobium sp.]